MFNYFDNQTFSIAIDFHYIFDHTIEVNGSRKTLVNKIVLNIFFYVPQNIYIYAFNRSFYPKQLTVLYAFFLQKKVIQVLNDTRERKWWQMPRNGPGDDFTFGVNPDSRAETLGINY